MTTKAWCVIRRDRLVASGLGPAPAQERPAPGRPFDEPDGDQPVSATAPSAMRPARPSGHGDLT